MRFGTYHVFQCSPGKAPARVVAEEIARAELAEALGFDDIWLPEQHFSPYCLAATRSSSPGTWPRVRAASGSAPRRKPMDVNAFALHMPPEGHPLRKERTDPLCFRWCIGDGRRARRPRRSPPARCGRSSTAVPPSRQTPAPARARGQDPTLAALARRAARPAVTTSPPRGTASRAIR